MLKIKAYAAQNATSPLAPFPIVRRPPGPKDVEIDIHYCGVCHTDIHQARNEWHGTTYPCVPGHEIVGVVTSVGSSVRGFKVGDKAAIGCMVGACGHCASCKDGEEQFCDQGPTWTYNSEDKISGGTTFGGYSEGIVVDEAFVLSLCPSPLRRNHHLLTAPSLERQIWAKGRCRRTGWLRPYGHQVCCRLRC